MKKHNTFSKQQLVSACPSSGFISTHLPEVCVGEHVRGQEAADPLLLSFLRTAPLSHLSVEGVHIASAFTQETLKKKNKSVSS